MEPMYEALNTPNYPHSIKKKHWAHVVSQYENEQT
jgi:hypothetical protein